MFLAVARYENSGGRTPLEDRCTEMLATLIARHPREIGVPIYESLTGEPLEGSAHVAATTQRPTSTGKRIDLVLAVDGAESCWVEVKVNSKQGDQQLANYKTAIQEMRLSNVLLVTLDKLGDPDDWDRELGCPSEESSSPYNTWHEIAKSVRDNARVPTIFDKDDLAAFEHESSLQIDAAHFLFYLHTQGIVTMSPTIQPTDLDRLQEVVGTIASLERLWSPNADAIQPALEEIFDGWTKDFLSDKRGKNHPSRHITKDETIGAIWWWNAVYRPDMEDFKELRIDCSITDRKWWVAESTAESGPGIVCGVAVYKDSAKQQAIDLPYALNKAEQQYELIDNGNGWLRAYAFIPLGPLLVSPDGHNQANAVHGEVVKHLEQLREFFDRSLDASTTS